jgi:hypothetical protein
MNDQKNVLILASTTTSVLITFRIAGPYVLQVQLCSDYYYGTYYT